MGDSTESVSQCHIMEEHIQTPKRSFDSVSQDVTEMSSSEDGGSFDVQEDVLTGSIADSGHGSLSSLVQGDIKTAWVTVDDDVTYLQTKSEHQPTVCTTSWLERCVSDDSSRVYTLSDKPVTPYCHCAPLPLLPSTDLPLDGTPTFTDPSHTGCPGSFMLESPVLTESCVQQLTPESAAQTAVSIFTVPVHDELDHQIDDTCLVEMRILQKSEVPSATSLTDVPNLAKRCDSTLSSASEKLDICRICHCEGEENNKLISPCLCSGSLKFIHLTCLQKWIKSSDKKSCELCNFEYVMTTKTKAFKQWEKLEMTAAERRKIICSVTFHIIAITCVIWSLYVLIDRSTEEVHSGSLDWPFWTKLIVVAIGFTGGLVFMYVQCKMYIQLCLRLHQFNKIITVENAPEDPVLRAEAAAKIKAKSGEKTGVVNPVALQEVDSF